MPPQFIVMLALRTMAPNFSDSLRQKASNAAGESATGSPPSVASRARTSGSCTATAMARCIRSVIAAGADGIAVIGALFGGDDIREAARDLRLAVETALSERAAASA